jgi:nicotinamide-nucleotide amidase
MTERKSSANPFDDPQTRSDDRHAEGAARAAVGRLFVALRGAGQTLALAESCTGGLFCELVVSLPGSSAVLLEGRVVYSNEAKVRLGVPSELIERHGAVSEPVALALAERMRTVAGSDWAGAISGIAGPGGGSEAKPVGTVCLALAGPGGARAWTARFVGNRASVRLHACAALAEEIYCAALPV